MVHVTDSFFVDPCSNQTPRWIVCVCYSACLTRGNVSSINIGYRMMMADIGPTLDVEKWRLAFNGDRYTRPTFGERHVQSEAISHQLPSGITFVNIYFGLINSPRCQGTDQLVTFQSTRRLF